MGNAQSTNPGPSVPVAAPPASCPVKHDAMPTAVGRQTATVPSVAGGGACPVKHDAVPSSPGLPATCPVSHNKEKRDRGVVYNVYAEPIDPKNMMPANANQTPAPGQQGDLSVERVQSTIPKGGTEATWLYPSPQMFYNALVRKGKAADVETKDVGMVVAIHNEMNERAWRQLIEWEALHKGEHIEGEPSLRRFMGKPWTPSPKARLKSWLGFGFPFDRHDWFVDRGGREVRYVIDYYYNPDPAAAATTAQDTAAAPPLRDGEPRLTRAIHVDVRPAVDDLTSALDRLRLFPARALQSLRRPWFRAEGLDPAKAPKEAAALGVLHSSSTLASEAPAPADQAAADAASDREWEVVDSKCGALLTRLQAVDAAGGEGGAEADDERRRLAVQLRTCVGSVVCPDGAKKFLRIMEEAEKGGRDAAATEEAAFRELDACVSKRASERRERRLRIASLGNATAEPGGAAAPSQLR